MGHNNSIGSICRYCIRGVLGRGVNSHLMGNSTDQKAQSHGIQCLSFFSPQRASTVFYHMPLRATICFEKFAEDELCRNRPSRQQAKILTVLMLGPSFGSLLTVWALLRISFPQTSSWSNNPMPLLSNCAVKTFPPIRPALLLFYVKHYQCNSSSLQCHLGLLLLVLSVNSGSHNFNISLAWPLVQFDYLTDWWWSP